VVDDVGIKALRYYPTMLVPPPNPRRRLMAPAARPPMTASPARSERAWRFDESLLVVALLACEEGEVLCSLFCGRARFSCLVVREGFLSGMMVPPTSYITTVSVAV
jgi:hypothetical protein